MGFGIGQPVKRKHAVNQGLDAPVSNGWQYVSHKTRYPLGALFGCALLVGHTKQGQAPGMQRFNVDLCLQHAINIAHGCQTALKSHAANTFSKH